MGGIKIEGEEWSRETNRKLIWTCSKITDEQRRRGELYLMYGEGE